MCETPNVAVEREKVTPRGLEGVVATTTAISSVSDNFLQYRGYRIEELVGKAEYEEVAYLLLNGDLPNKNELRDFKAELTKHRTLSPFLREILRQMSESGTPMDVLRTVISASAVEDPGEGDNSHEAEYRKAIRLTAKLPTILATYIRRRRGEQPVTPDPTLGHAANFARMAGLDEAHPRAAEILNACFILQAEHGLNASTFAARITAATLADMHAAAIEKARPSMSPAAAEKVNVVNVDFYAATTYTFLGIPADLGTSIFAVGRMAGWCAHIMEQHGDNRLIRPESEYTGPTGKRWVPIAER